MTRQIIFILTIATIFAGCNNFSDKVNDSVDNSVKDAKVEMSSDVANAKATFTETYNKILLGSTDSIVIKKITNLYSSINKTSIYIDSLKTEIIKLDNNDFKNTDLIKKTFLNDGIGDSVFNKVKLSYTFAIDVALADTTKSRLKTAQDTYTTETKKQFFELNGPLGVNMILYGIESELIKDGTRSLYGYKTK